MGFKWVNQKEGQSQSIKCLWRPLFRLTFFPYFCRSGKAAKDLTQSQSIYKPGHLIQNNKPLSLGNVNLPERQKWLKTYLVIPKGNCAWNAIRTSCNWEVIVPSSEMHSWPLPGFCKEPVIIYLTRLVSITYQQGLWSDPAVCCVFYMIAHWKSGRQWPWKGIRIPIDTQGKRGLLWWKPLAHWGPASGW